MSGALRWVVRGYDAFVTLDGACGRRHAHLG